MIPCVDTEDSCVHMRNAPDDTGLARAVRACARAHADDERAHAACARAGSSGVHERSGAACVGPDCAFVHADSACAHADIARVHARATCDDAVAARSNTACAGVYACRTNPAPSPLTDVASGRYHVTMIAVGIKRLKNSLSHYVRRAAAGETIRITDRDEVVAELRPPSPDAVPFLEAEPVLADLVRRGLARGPRCAPSQPALPEGPLVSMDQLLAELARCRPR